MAEPYPFELRTISSATKSRTQPAAFNVYEPRRGYGYAQATGTDTPVFWDVTFRFTRPEAVRYQIWFKQIIANGVDEFTMPIKTEFGEITHTCRFLPESLNDARQDGLSWTYSAKIMARAQIVPDEFIDAQDLILALNYWDMWAEFLDLAIVEVPEE